MTIKRIELSYDSVKSTKLEDLPNNFYLEINGYDFINNAEEINKFLSVLKYYAREVKFQSKSINRRGYHLYKVTIK